MSDRTEKIADFFGLILLSWLAITFVGVMVWALAMIWYTGFKWLIGLF